MVGHLECLGYNIRLFLCLGGLGFDGFAKHYLGGFGARHGHGLWSINGSWRCLCCDDRCLCCDDRCLCCSRRCLCCDRCICCCRRCFCCSSRSIGCWRGLCCDNHRGLSRSHCNSWTEGCIRWGNLINGRPANIISSLNRRSITSIIITPCNPITNNTLLASIIGNPSLHGQLNSTRQIIELITNIQLGIQIIRNTPERDRVPIRKRSIGVGVILINNNEFTRGVKLQELNGDDFNVCNGLAHFRLFRDS
mmetsp:Transcript_18706/g.40505  ORF Transcript_18706/g.40505 Transcript_18706/m.40505 type:complete len:250 (-) Transcript_18706:274-1023(-)